MNTTITLAIVGAGPAGLMAAETAANMGVRDIHVFDAMPSVGRKFLLAGIGGLNLTHSEPNEVFFKRYHPVNAQLLASLEGFDGQTLRNWCTGLGIDTFVGSSGRVFPKEMKAAPLLRAWLARLKSQGVQFHSRHRWLGFKDLRPNQSRQLCFETPTGLVSINAAATVLALGGASWSKLGSDGAWQTVLNAHGVSVQPLIPANCGFNVAWSDFFIQHCAGAVLKNIAVKQGNGLSVKGELVLTKHGIEGGLVYAQSRHWRDALMLKQPHTVYIDLLPNHALSSVVSVCQSRGSRSLSSHLNGRLGLNKTALILLRECLSTEQLHHPVQLAQAIKALPIGLTGTRPLDEAISTAGGIVWQSLGGDYQLRQLTGVFCAGEMLDWEAPTGGYLLTACWATGRAAGIGVARYIHQLQSTI
jgi:uncharacterized flavoprotein (TIGR03862 family)